ncbi:uncharacterized protein LOC119682350 [Teleopsis dalmanni]|uniref:uncharacterized protein LOC119682350 n=1 Tax=Teleopsis dalmanni TaxID=139649 RepID=UPI0018CC8BA6|nr:uncharacterized protein LOC119682350 [Teleopsis dalmanni]
MKRALENSLKTAVEVKEFSFEKATKDGENYCSDIYRIYVKYIKENDISKKLHEKSFIIKDVGEIEQPDTSEMFMYEKVLPKLEEILESTGENVKLKPSCYLTISDKIELYVLEDLVASGYHIADRWVGLNDVQAKVILQKVAKFHAASMIYVERFPEEIAKLEPAGFSSDNFGEVARVLYIDSVEYVAHMIQNDWNGYEEIARKMLKNKEKFHEKVKKLVNPKNSKLNVINHADLWLNNFLYNYSDENFKEPQDAVLIDFQNCYLGSLGLDINFLIYTSFDLNTIKSDQHKLLRCYYDELERTLKLCGATIIPTWESVIDEINATLFVAYYAVVCEMPMCCMSLEASEGFQNETYTNKEVMAEKRKLIYSNKRVLDTLRYMLDYLNKMGILD